MPLCAILLTHKTMYKKIYFVGIKGVGMASLAIIAKQAHFIVSGSDLAEEFITDEILKKEEIPILTGFAPSHITEFIGTSKSEEVLVIVTAAHNGLENVEAVEAKKLGVKVITHGVAVGLFMSGELFGRKDLIGVSVSGAHGKTTISAFLSSSLVSLGMDPSFTVGTSEIFPTGSSGHYGKGQYFVAEADEYISEIKTDRTPKFLYQNPQFLIINNIDFDHPDYYEDIDAVEKEFVRFVGKMNPLGTLFINGDDARCVAVSKQAPEGVKVITYGVSEANTFVISNYEENEFSGRFTVGTNGMILGRFEIGLPGFHNAKNAMAVIAFLLEIGVSVAKIIEVLPKFTGTKRRIELIGKTRDGGIIIDDYAHHPEEIRKTLSAIRGMSASKKIVCIFQPHTFSRTQALFSEFVSSFMDADFLLFLPTFSSARDDSGDEKEQALQMRNEFGKIGKEVVMLEPHNVVEYVNKNFASDKYIIVTMGAGNVYKLGYELANY